QIQTIKNGPITIGAVDGTIVVDHYAIEGPGPSWCRFGKAQDIFLKIRHDNESIIFRNTRFDQFSDIIDRLSSMVAVYEKNELNQSIGGSWEKFYLKENPVNYDGNNDPRYKQNFEFMKTSLLNAGMRLGDAFLDVGCHYKPWAARIAHDLGYQAWGVDILDPNIFTKMPWLNY
ncbi:hypothetical protein OAH90_02125, partial [Alphaproteobacteria bacterium]|nr:hypothetical protein [Alphaproteobacteria bacterium]